MGSGIFGGNALGVYIRSFTFDPASVSANTTSEQTVTVPGLKTTDVVDVQKPSHTTGLSIGNSRVSAADTLSIQLINNTGSAIDAASETWQVIVFRPESNIKSAVSV